jgi:Domain of unknown function (DUF4360)
LYNVIVGVGLLFTSAIGPVAPAAAAPPTDRITIEKLKVNGSGCRHQTTAVAVSPDAEAFTVGYSTYIAQTGPDARPRDALRNCSITVRLNVPAGITYAVSHTDHRGFAHLEPGATGMLRAGYRFQGHGPRTGSEKQFSGPFSDDWQVTHSGPATPVFGPCGRDRKLDIDTELTVAASQPAATSMIAMDSTDNTVQSTYRLLWRNC